MKFKKGMLVKCSYSIGVLSSHFHVDLNSDSLYTVNDVEGDSIRFIPANKPNGRYGILSQSYFIPANNIRRRKI